jgi:arabinogalactan oligomer/maltooligosaccharide transport system permease protein
MKKTLTSPLLSALVIPGAGQLNNRQYVKGVIMIVVVLVSLSAFIIKICRDVLSIISSTGQDKMSPDNISQLAIQVQQKNAGIIVMLMLLFLVVWIYGIIDAYVYGKKINQKKW